jgi:4-hydroxybenzoate polyprenyltransferase
MVRVIYRLTRKLLIILEAIKFEHTVFALPFALSAALLARDRLPSTWTLAWILVAMVGARSSAMAFNRIVDLHYDKLNPRTANRALPAGMLKVSEVAVFTIVSAAIFVLAARMLNPLAFTLSPVALVIILGYSFTKRFTTLSHLFLGLALGIAPTAGWIAVTGQLHFAPMVLSAAVIYALQDIDFDRKHGLYSIPAKLGSSKALAISRLFHTTAIMLLALFGLMLQLGTIYYIGIAIIGILLIYEQSLVKPHDLSRVNTAFFVVNGIISIGYFIFTTLDMICRH